MRIGQAIADKAVENPLDRMNRIDELESRTAGGLVGSFQNLFPDPVHPVNPVECFSGGAEKAMKNP